ncbi:hypothetical protein BGW38_000229 [Lunasporangiospora selenospora]|uniref:J domain-containing protein n=1 Tax=Lunasporangiospora selenospora TaxID=979761 RepID=A0A9P6FVT5_9FUNG|nr:hypothetical protein BGW38_000229 [Lunasporangiospora selenospora]
MDSLTGLAGWYILPGFATNVIQSIWYSIKYPVNSGAKPVKGSPRYHRHFNMIYCFVILGYLVYTIAEVDRATPKNFYDELDLDFHSFSQRQLKTNFRKISLLVHPDKFGQLGAETFVRIRAAHDILSDPVARTAYDRFGPSILECQTCRTTKDFVSRGLSSTLTFYLSSGAVLVLMSVFGKAQFGRYWRFIVLFGMAALELAMVTRFEPITILSWIMPHRVTFEQIAILHQVFISTFIAINQIGPIVAPSKEHEKGSVNGLVNYLESLITISNTESIGQLQNAFDVFRGDEGQMTHLRNQMNMMALDSQLAQDQLLNEARTNVQRRMART